MRIREILKKRSKGVSFEFFPPRSVEGKEGFMEVVNALRHYDPAYVSVTYGAGGSTQDRTRNTLLWIKEETDLTVMSHLTCIGATKIGMDSLLRDYMANGIDNILALRGDPPRGVPDFDPTRGEFKYARDLVEFIRRYDYFSIAVAVYPEGHQESPNIERDIEYTKQKIDAGADFGITQMFFDNRYYYDFMDRAEKKGITIPIIPGIMPITDYRKISEFAALCRTTIPGVVRKRMEAALDKPYDMKRLGVEHAIRQCEDLLSNGVRYLHFYTLNKSDAVSEVLDAIADYP